MNVNIDFDNLPQKRAALPSIKTSKLLAKYKGRKTEAQLLHETAMKRMLEGLHQALSLHKPIELSAICGVLGLKTLEKAQTSMDQIMDYAKDGEDLSETKVEEVVHAMWEGALFEYLRFIGAPLQSVLADPKIQVLRIWKQGVLTSGDFVPHYIERLIPERYNDIQSKDITKFTTKLKTLEDRVKITEYRLHENRDYRNVLTYFQQMAELRKMETDAREYFIHELEICRAKLIHTESSGALVKESLDDLEHRYTALGLKLTEDLAIEESICEQYLKSRLELEADIHRQSNILKKFISKSIETGNYLYRVDFEALLNKPDQLPVDISPLRDGNQGAHSSLQTPETNLSDFPSESRTTSTSPSILSINAQIMRYHQLREAMSAQSLEKDKSHMQEIEKLEYIIKNLESQLSFERAVVSDLTYQLDLKNKNLIQVQSQYDNFQNISTNTNKIAWESLLSTTATLNMYKHGFNQLKPYIADALTNRNASIVSICTQFAVYFDIFNHDEISIIVETARMSREDAVSWAVRKEYLEKLAKKKKKIKTSGASKKPGKGGRGGAAGKGRTVAGGKGKLARGMSSASMKSSVSAMSKKSSSINSSKRTPAGRKSSTPGSRKSSTPGSRKSSGIIELKPPIEEMIKPTKVIPKKKK